MDDKYNIYNDYYFETYLEEKDLAEETEKNYAKQLKKFCLAANKPLKDIIDECKDQQSIEIEEIISSEVKDGNTINHRKVTKFDVDGSDSYIKKYFSQFETYCRNRGNKNGTINSGMDCIKSVLSHFNVTLPNWKNLPNDAKDWNLLSKEDFKFVLADSSLMHKSLITFMLSSGLRITDCLNITIGEFMEATSDYHDSVEVDDFIDNAPDDMMGYWDFTPHKTIKKNIICKTFNSPESSNFIIQNLRRIKNEYLPRKFKKGDPRLKLSKSNFIFGSKRSFYKKPPLSNSISTMYGLKNKKLYDWHTNKIKQDIKDGKISSEDYDKYVALIPLFHPHSCRKYFCTIIERHCANERRYRLMEGHSPSNKIDKSYINISKEEIKEVYDEAVGDLSVYYTDEHDIEKMREDFNQQLVRQEEKYQETISSLEKQLVDKDKKHEAEIKHIKASVNDMQKQMDENLPLGRITSRKTRSDIEQSINKYCKNNLKETNMRKDYVIRRLALDYALENKSEFEDTDDYLSSLIKKIRLKLALSDETIEEQFNQIMEQDNNDYIENKDMNNAMREIMKVMTANEEIMSIIGDGDYYGMQDAIETHLRQTQYDLVNLTDADKKQIINDVLMEYL